MHSLGRPSRSDFVQRKFINSIFLGVLKALFEAMKIPAIAVTLQGVLSGSLTMKHVLLSFSIMLLSVAGNAFANYCSTMLQCETGYGTCAEKRIEIAEHLKYLPMGYFNWNSFGYITSVATNSMEALADVAARVVMMVTQGILTTAVVVLMICAFDLRNVELYVSKAQSVLDMPTMDIDGKDITPASYDIDVENVEFSYDKRKIIDGVSVHISQKTITAIVEPSGGKTTICHLIARFWDVEKGSVKLEAWM